MKDVAFRIDDVAYLPVPNTVEVVISSTVCTPLLTSTAFMIPVFDDGSVLLARNQNRGIEIPGGHVEGDESLLDAAIREALEETGCIVTDVRPIGFLRMICHGEKPDNHRYPFPLCYQQFFAGRVKKQLPFRVTDECAKPIRLHDVTGIERNSVRIFVEAARQSFLSTPSQ